VGVVVLPHDVIAFERDVGGRSQIFTMEADGQGITRRTFDPSVSATHPSFSPDGRQIAFTRTGPSRGVFVIDADGSGLHPLTRADSNDDSPSWSPDGKLISVSYMGTIGVRPPEGGLYRAIVIGTVSDFQGTVSWSPDSRRMVFASSYTLPRGDTAIFIAGTDRQNDVRMLPGTEGGTAAAWSPDGKTIAITGRIGGGTSDLYLIDPDGTNLRRLTNDAVVDSRPVWSPDGTEIAFNRLLGNYEIHVIRANGTGLRRLTDHAERDFVQSWTAAPPP
jgi:TolB protein